MDFFSHQDRARRQTKWLVLYFLLAVLFTVVGVYGAVVVAFVLGDEGMGGSLWIPELFLVCSAVTLALILGGMGWRLFQLRHGGVAVAEALGGRLVDYSTRDPLEVRLLNVVEEMAIASGVPPPPVYIMDDEGGINAFAAGNTPRDAVIGMTRGALEWLDRNELQGVVAHEFSHILNGDMRLNTRLIGLLSGILLISGMGEFLLRGGSRRSRHHYHHSSVNHSSDDRGGNVRLAIFGVLLLVVGYLGYFWGRLIQAAVSRQREFLADASAVQFTRYPDGIAGALRKIGGLTAGSQVHGSHVTEASHLFFGAVGSSWLRLTATHPPLDERIRRIDPRFDGTFPEPVAVEEPAEEPEAGESLPPPAPGSSPWGAPAAGALSGAAPWGGGGAGVAALPAPLVEPGAPGASPPVAASPWSKRVGEVGAEELAFAQRLMASLPPEAAEALRDPAAARALVYVFLVGREAEEVKRQVQLLTQREGQEMVNRVVKVHKALSPELRAQRLSLVSLAVTPIGQLETAGQRAFLETVEALVMADQRVSLFELCLRKVVEGVLEARRSARLLQREKVYRSFKGVGEPLAVLLSTLAGQGSGDRERAFAAGVGQLGEGMAGLSPLPEGACTVPALGGALDELAQLAPPLKRLLVDACAACVAHDGVVDQGEGELLRAVCAVLICPLPPLLQEQRVGAAA